MTTFADTSFWTALLVKRDQHHQRGMLWWRYARRTRLMLVTSEAVLWEMLNSLASRGTRQEAIGMYGHCHRDEYVEVVPSTDALVTEALALYESRPDKQWGITDCSSFLIMQQHGIQDALTADHHFEQAGFRAVLAADPPA